MSVLAHLSSSSAVRASVSTGIVATAQSSAQETSPTIAVNPLLFSALAVALALAGIYLARLVTIDQEDKRLGRKQTYRETGPLTWIAVLIVCPLIWQLKIAPQYASVIGLGVGYSVRVVLKIIGGATTAAARAIARQAVESLDREEQERRKDADQPAPAPTPALSAPAPPSPPRPHAVYLPPETKMDDPDDVMGRLGMPHVRPGVAPPDEKG